MLAYVQSVKTAKNICKPIFAFHSIAGQARLHTFLAPAKSRLLKSLYQIKDEFN